MSQLSGHEKLESLQPNIHEQPKTNVQHIDIRRYTRTGNIDIHYPTTALEYSNWNPVLSSTFHGALISNYSFNINVYNNKKSSPSKRRRVIIEDNSH